MTTKTDLAAALDAAETRLAELNETAKQIPDAEANVEAARTALLEALTPSESKEVVWPEPSDQEPISSTRFNGF